jgi:protein O-GlcNAc transferase
MPTISETLDAARRHHQAGRRAEAVSEYGRVIEQDPDNLQALFQLGVLHLETNEPAAAVEWLLRAVRLDPLQPAIQITLGEGYRRLGDLARAFECNREAVRVRPDFVPAMSNLGLLLWRQGNLVEAAEWLRKRAQLVPADPGASVMLGDVLVEQKAFVEAESCFRRALALAPGNAEFRGRLALALQSLGRFDDAAAEFRNVLASRPQDAAALVNLGVCLQRLGDDAQAEACYRRALEIDTEFAPAHGNLGALLVERHRCAEALAYCRRAIELRPQVAEAYMNLANAQQELGKPDEAIETCRRGIEKSPHVSQLYCNLGFSYREIGALDQALAAFRESVRLAPTDPQPHSNLLYTLNFVSGMAPQAVFAEHQRWAERHADPLTRTAPPHANPRTTDRRLRVGYVSAHFRGHAVNFFVEPILASHDHGAFEVFCYSNVTPADCDTTTARLRGFADHWLDIGLSDDAAAARRVRDDQIDILVDLSGHIAGNRLGVFARRPAPVQVSYIGYQNTTGMKAIDYRLTDNWSDPPQESDACYSEQLIRLPGSFFCYLPAESPPVAPLPALANGYVTFASLNHFAKVTPQVLEAWSQVLASVLRSRLILIAPASHALRARVVETFQRRGVDAARIEFIERQPHAAYLETVSRADVALDPFPFNGHTTTCDCLWMGVPVVSLAGRTYASRFGSSGLVTLGHEEWIADSVERYVDVAVRVANDPDKLSRWRATLRARMTASRLLDFAGFTRNLEDAYRRMWQRWCAG